MKKLFLIVPLLIMTVSGSLMAKTGFEVNVLIPFGFSMGTYTGTDASKYKKADTAFEFGIHVIPGYYFGLSSVNLGIGLDLGYQKDVFAFSVSGESQKHGYSFDSFHLGLLPRIDVAFISVGIGGGIKFPIAGLSYTRIDKDSIGNAQMYNTKNIYDNFTNPFIPYVKATLDFILPLNLTLGIYLSYDIPLMESKQYNIKLSSVDLGAQVGIRF